MGETISSEEEGEEDKTAESNTCRCATSVIISIDQ